MTKNSEPLVSIIIATYNRACVVGQTIESALNQTYSNKEVIVVDDGSKDKTGEFIQKNYPQVQYIFQENSERGAARNNGLAHAKGEFIVILDSDDLLHQEMIETHLKVFKNHDEGSNHRPLGVVYGQVRLIDSQGKFIKNRYSHNPPQGRVTLDLLRAPLLQVTALVKRKCFDECGDFVEDRSLSGSEDYELWFRISKSYDFAYSQSLMLDYRIHDNQTANNPEKNHKNMLKCHELIFKQSETNPELLRLKNYTLGNFYKFTAANFYNNSQKFKAIKYFFKAISLSPRIAFELKTMLLLIRILFGKNLMGHFSKMRRS